MDHNLIDDSAMLSFPAVHGIEVTGDALTEVIDTQSREIPQRPENGDDDEPGDDTDDDAVSPEEDWRALPSCVDELNLQEEAIAQFRRDLVAWIETKLVDKDDPTFCLQSTSLSVCEDDDADAPLSVQTSYQVDVKVRRPGRRYLPASIAINVRLSDGILN